MPFTNIGPDLVLPPGAPLTPGSGTVYIGGPQLPTSMSQFESAIIFYTDALGLAAGIDYWYLAHFGASHAPFTSDGVQVGFYPTGGPLTKSNIGAFVTGSGFDNVIIEANSGDAQIKTNGGGNVFVTSNNQVTIQSQSGQLIYYCSGYGNHSFRQTPGVNTEIAEIRNLGVAPNIKALNSSTIDVWQSATRTVTLAGVANVVLQESWRTTIDGITEYRYFINFPSAPASMSFNYVTNAGVPRPDAAPFSLAARGTSLVQNPIQMIPTAIDTTGTMFVFGAAGTGAQFVSGVTLWTNNKP